jgi:hypothetical protein
MAVGEVFDGPAGARATSPARGLTNASGLCLAPRVFIRNGCDTPKLVVDPELVEGASAWFDVGAALCRDPNVATRTNRGVKPLLQ